MVDDEQSPHDVPDREEARALETPIGSAEPGVDPDHPTGRLPEDEPGAEAFPTGDEQAERNRRDDSPA